MEAVISQKELEIEILENAMDDWYGLYETIWWLNSQYQLLSKSQKMEACIAAINHLLDIGVIDVYESNWNRKSPRKLEREEISRVLKDPKSWNEPNGTSKFFTYKGNEKTRKELESRYSSL